MFKTPQFSLSNRRFVLFSDFLWCMLMVLNIKVNIISTQVINASSNILIYTFVGNSFREQFVKMFQIKILFCNAANVFQRWKLDLKKSNWSMDILFTGKTREKMVLAILSWAQWWRKGRQMNRHSELIVFSWCWKYTYSSFKTKYDSSCNKPLEQ